jgi:hypothetical protein
VKLFLMTLFSVLILTACGYKPSSRYVKEIFADSVYVEVKVDTVEPENAPFIKDELNRLIYTRFKGHVTSKELAESKIYVDYKGTSYVPLAYRDGYVTRYRADIRVHFYMETKEGIMDKTISSRVESDIQASSLTSSTLRTEAIRVGLAKALDEFIGYVSAKGLQAHKKKGKVLKTQ